jgi:hypothetical protein
MSDRKIPTEGSDGSAPHSRDAISPPPRTRPRTDKQLAPDKFFAMAREDAPAGTESSIPARESTPKAQHEMRSTGSGKTTKDADGKWRPTGNHEVGFGRPPKHSRFNGKPGPGRPKGSLNYDTVLSKHLAMKRKVQIDGREQTLTQGELVIIATVRDALAGKGRDARKQVLADMQRMSPDPLPDTADAGSYNDADNATLEEYRRMIREELRVEIECELAGISGEGSKEP